MPQNVLVSTAEVSSDEENEDEELILHFVHNNAPNSDNDKLFKVRPIVTAIVAKLYKTSAQPTITQFVLG